MLTRGNGEKGPISGDAPFAEEILAGEAKKFLLGGIVDQDVAVLVVDSDNDHKVKRPLGAGCGEADDERASFCDVMRQVLPLAAKWIGVKASLLKVFLHGRAGNAFFALGIEGGLNFVDVGTDRIGVAGFPAPILEEHGDGSGAAAFRWLLYEGNVDPESVSFSSW